MNTLTSAARLATAAATARPISNLSIRAGTVGFFLRLGEGGIAAPPPVAALPGSGGAAWDATGAAVPVGAAAAGVGILTVGAEVGFGGKVIRTVSFFGWILIVSSVLFTTGASTLGSTLIESGEP